MAGEPRVRGLRITLLAYLVTYPSQAELLEALTGLEEEDIRQALAFSRERPSTSGTIWLPP